MMRAGFGEGGEAAGLQDAVEFLEGRFLVGHVVEAFEADDAVDGAEVDSPGDIARSVNRKKDGEVTLTVIRNKSQQTFRVTPREGNPGGDMGEPEIGRRIVIPRIEIPTIPDVDIRMPRIRVPAVEINLPRIRVTPQLRRISRERGPI